MWAARGLGNIGDDQAVEPLIKSLRDKDWGVRVFTAEALSKLGDSRAIEPLFKAFNDVPNYKEDIEAERCNPNSNVRFMTTMPLGKFGDARVIKDLLDYLSDSGWETRKLVAEILVQFSKKNPKALVDHWQKVFLLVKERHTDSYKHFDDGGSSDCSHSDNKHTDKGIGLRFPNPPKEKRVKISTTSPPAAKPKQGTAPAPASPQSQFLAAACPNCRTGHKVPSTAMGKSIRCPKCQAIIQIRAQPNK